MTWWGLSFIEPLRKLLGFPANKTIQFAISKKKEMPPKNRQSLTKKLESKVLAIVRRYVDDLPVSQDQQNVRLSVTDIYTYILADGGVPRQKKSTITEMIEAAIRVLREEGEDDEENEIDSDFEGLNEEGFMEPTVGIFCPPI